MGLFLNLFSGYRTYIAAAGMAALAIYHLSLVLTGKADASMTFASVWMELMAALATAGLRAAVTKAVVAIAPNLSPAQRKAI